jgi:O-antigen/teichoic acid export membrane protein
MLTSTALMFQTFAGFGLGATATKHVAELRTKNPVRAGRILALVEVLSGGTGLLAALALALGSPWLCSAILGAPHLSEFMRIAAVPLLLSTIASVQAGALAGFEAFQAVARTSIAAGVIAVPLSIGGVYWWGLSGAMWAAALSAGAQFLLTFIAVREHARGLGISFALKGWTQELPVVWSFSFPAFAAGVMVVPVNWLGAAILVNSPGGYLEMGVFNAANQWFAAIMLIPNALGGATLPVLSERIGHGDGKGASAILRASMLLNVAVVAPVLVLIAAASPVVMGLYGHGFQHAWPTLVAILGTAGLLAAQAPAGLVLVASGKLWLGFFMNTGWAIAFLVAALVLAEQGSLGLALARFLAYALHGAWTLWFAVGVIKRYSQGRARS